MLHKFFLVFIQKLFNEHLDPSSEVFEEIEELETIQSAVLNPKSSLILFDLKC